MATTSTRRRKAKAITLHPAGSLEARADVAQFIRQEQRLRDRRDELRELARSSQRRERKRPL